MLVTEQGLGDSQRSRELMLEGAWCPWKGTTFRCHTEGFGAVTEWILSVSCLLASVKRHGGGRLGLRGCDLISRFWELHLRIVSEIKGKKLAAGVGDEEG